MTTTRNFSKHQSVSRARRRWPAAVLGATCLFVAAGVCADSPGEAAPAGKVNINQASAAQIAFLPRIGAKVATRVLEYRTSHGPFARTEDLMEVKGIGEKLFLALKPYLAVSGPTTLAAKVHAGSPRKKGASVPANKPAQKTAPASVPAGKGR
jgi:competence protein ComEA